MNIRSSAERLLWILLPALRGVAQAKELFPSLGCLSVCKTGAGGVPCSIIQF